MHNYFVSYNLFKENTRTCSGEAFVEVNKKILTNEDLKLFKKALEEDCEKICKPFTYLQTISLNYLGEIS